MRRGLLKRRRKDKKNRRMIMKMKTTGIRIRMLRVVANSFSNNLIKIYSLNSR